MPIIKSAAKRMRQTARRHARNAATKRNFRAAMKAFTQNPTLEDLQKAQSKLDIAVKKNLLSQNTAARKKAQLASRAKAAGVKMVKPVTKATTKKPTTSTTKTTAKKLEA